MPGSSTQFKSSDTGAKSIWGICFNLALAAFFLIFIAVWPHATEPAAIALLTRAFALHPKVIIGTFLIPLVAGILCVGATAAALAFGRTVRLHKIAIALTVVALLSTVAGSILISGLHVMVVALVPIIAVVFQLGGFAVRQ